MWLWSEMVASTTEDCIALTLKQRQNLIAFMLSVLDPTSHLWKPIRPEASDSLDDKTWEENTTEETIIDI